MIMDATIVDAITTGGQFSQLPHHGRYKLNRLIFNKSFPE